MRRSPVLSLFLLALAAAFPLAAQDGDGGSVGAGIVGGVTGGVAGLLGVYPLLGCPLATLGASRETDFCDVASVVSAVGGVAAGAWIGGTDRGAGYGMGVGLVAGFGAGLLLGQVVDTPRWVDALLLVGGVVAGGILGSDDEADRAVLVVPDGRVTPLFTLPLFRF